MIRLTRRGWNNVLILSVLFMLLLFNSSQWLHQRSDKLLAPRTLILADQVPLAFEFDQTKIQRVGQSWRLNGTGAFPFSASDYASAWQTIVMTPIPQATLQQGYVVTVSMAGEEKPFVYTLLSIGEDIIVQLDGLTYRIENTPISTLIPLLPTQ